MTIGTPNGWNEYSRLVLGQIDSLTKGLEGVHNILAGQGRSLAVLESELGHLRKSLDKLDQMIETLGKAQQGDSLELARRSMPYSIGAAVITSIVIGVVMAFVAKGGP